MTSVDKLKGGHSSSVLSVDVNSQTAQILSGGENGELCLWSSDGKLIRKIARPDTDCTSVLFSKENPKIAYAAFGSEILMYDLSRFQDPIFVFQSNTDEINQVVFDAKEEFLAACDDAGEIKVYSLQQERKVFKTLRFRHTNICSSLIFRPRKNWELLSGGLDCQLVHWDFSKPRSLKQWNMQELHSSHGPSAYMVNPPLVHHLTASPAGSSIACALENGQIPVFDASKKNIKHCFSFTAHRQGVSQVRFIEEDKLVSAGNDMDIALWDLSKAEFPGQKGASCASSDNGDESEQKSVDIAELCRVQVISHPNKVNWMIPSVQNDTTKLYVADQSSDVSILSLP